MQKKAFSGRLARNMGALGVMQLVNYIAPLVVLLHLTTVLGVELYGIVAFSTGIVLLCWVLMDFGYSLSATNKISLNRENKLYVSSLIGAIFKVKMLLFAFVFLVLVFYAFFSKKYVDHKAVIVFSALPIFFQGMIPTWFFQGVERLKNVAAYTILSKFIFLILVVTFIRSDQLYWLVPVFNGIGQLVAFLLALSLIYRLGYKVNLKGTKMVRYALQINKGFFLSRISVASYIQAGPVLLGLVSTPTAVAVYSIAEQLYKVMQSAISPVVQAVYPYMVKEKNIDLYKKISIWLISAVIVAALAGYFVSPYLLPWVFGTEWLESVPVLNVFLVAIVVHVCAVLAGYPICAAVNRLYVANQSVVLGSLVYFFVFIIFYFLDLLSPVNIAVMMVLAEFYVFVHRFSGIQSAIFNVKNKEAL